MSVDLGTVLHKQTCNKRAALCKDPAVTPQEAADRNLLFFHPLAIFYGDRGEFSATAKPLSKMCPGRIAPAAEWR